jgi:hypothetical protein
VVTRPKNAVAIVAKPDFASLLDKAKLPERVVKICMRADLTEAHEAAEEELKRAQDNPSNSLAGDGAAEIAERIQAIEAEMTASIYPFRLRALPAPRFRAFRAEYPMRIDDDGQVNKQDLVFTFDFDAGFEPLLRLSIVDPELDDDQWAKLMGTLTEKQFDDLAGAAWYLNRGEIDVPFSSAASRLMSGSGGESNSLNV